MQSADPFLQVIPSFKLRAARRLAEISRLVLVLQLTESWNNAEIAKLQLEARYFRHALRTLRNPGTLDRDQQRYICERLLPMLDEQSGVPFKPELEPDYTVPMRLSVGPPKILGLPSKATLVVNVLRNVPKEAELFLLRDGVRFTDPVPAKAGTSRYIDDEPGDRYIAQIWYQGRLIGQASATLDTLAPVRWGVMRGQRPTAAELARWSTAAPGKTHELVFEVPEGRYYLGVQFSNSALWQLLDPHAFPDTVLRSGATSELDITPSFVALAASPQQPSLRVLRQPHASIGPFTFLAQLNLS